MIGTVVAWFFVWLSMTGDVPLIIAGVKIAYNVGDQS